MIEQDTIKLLRECDAGITMGVDSIGDVLDRVKSEEFRKKLTDCKVEHEKLRQEVTQLLDKYHDDGKEICQHFCKLKKEESIAAENDVELQTVIKNDDVIHEAITALQVLGYPAKEASKAIEGIDTTGLSVEGIIKQALIYFSRN